MRTWPNAGDVHKARLMTRRQGGSSVLRERLHPAQVVGHFLGTTVLGNDDLHYTQESYQTVRLGN